MLSTTSVQLDTAPTPPRAPRLSWCERLICVAAAVAVIPTSQLYAHGEQSSPESSKQMRQARSGASSGAGSDELAAAMGLLAQFLAGRLLAQAPPEPRNCAKS